MQTSAKTRRSLLQAVCHWNVAGKARKKRKKTASFVASLRWRTAAIERTTCDFNDHACHRSGTTCCSASDHLKESHDTAVKAQGKATRTAWQSTISSGQLWLIRILQLLISRECFWSWGEAEREWWEAEVTSALHCVLWETKHPSARSPQWKVNQATVSRLSSASDGPGIVLFDKEAGSSGNFIAWLKFQAQALLYWGIFIAILIRGENKSSIFHPSSKMSWLTAECWRKALALASAGGCKSSMRIKFNNVFVPLSGVHPPPLLSCVSLPTQRNSTWTNLSNSAKNSALSVSCAPSTDVSGYAPAAECLWRFLCSVYSFSWSCPKTVSRTREVFPTGSTTLRRLQLWRTRDCAHRSRHVGIFFFFSFGEKGACPK